MRSLDAIITRFNRNVATTNIDNTLTVDKGFALAISTFFAFVTFKGIALLGREIQRTARNLEATLALDGVFFGFDGDIAVLDFKIVTALDAVFELSLDGQSTGALDVQIISRINSSLCRILRAVDFHKQVISVTIFNHVGRTLDQMKNRLVGIFHENRSIGTLNRRIVKIDARVAFVFGTRSIHHHLEIGRFTGDVIGIRASNRCAFVCNFNAAIVVFDSCRSTRKLQENLRTIQSSSIFVIIFVVAGFRAAGDCIVRTRRHDRNNIARARSSVGRRHST